MHQEFTGPYFDLWVYSLGVFQDKLFIGGNFRKEIGFTGTCLQYFDGEDMHEVGGGLNGPVYDMKVYKGELYVVGGFTRIGEGVAYHSDSGTPCQGVAKWDGEQWTCLFDGTFSAENWSGVYALEIYHDTLYMGGNWGAMNGDTAMASIARRKIIPKPGTTSLDDFNLFPNPAADQLNFDFGYLLGEDAQVTIFNPIGQIVRAFTISAWEQNYLLDTSFISSGMYIVNVQLGAAVETRKIFIE